MKSSDRAKGEYIPAPIWGLLKKEIADLRNVTTPSTAAAATAEYKLFVDYMADDFQVKVESGSRRIVVSAALIRHVLILLALEKESALVKLQSDLDVGILASDLARAHARDLAFKSRGEFREMFSFTLAHELAHVYLGTKDHLELREDRVDCFAAKDVYALRGSVTLGLVKWLDSDANNEATRFWGTEEQHVLAAVKRRIQALQERAAKVTQKQNSGYQGCGEI